MTSWSGSNTSIFFMAGGDGSAAVMASGALAHQLTDAAPEPSMHPLAVGAKALGTSTVAEASVGERAVFFRTRDNVWFTTSDSSTNGMVGRTENHERLDRCSLDLVPRVTSLSVGGCE